MVYINQYHVLYLETYNIKRNNIYVCDWQAQTRARYLYLFTKFHNQFTTSNHESYQIKIQIIFWN